MTTFSLVPLGTRLAALLLRASAMTTTPPPPSNDATAAPCANGAAAPVGATREDWLAVENLSGRGDEAAEVLGGRIAPRLEAGVADARRRCEERDVGIDSLRGALAEAELLLGEFAADDAVILTIAREPDRIEEVVRRRAQKHRQNVGAGAEPFFDALVRAVIGEITRLSGVGGSRQETADAAQPAFQSVLEQIRSRSPRQAVIARCQLETLALLAASGVPARWLEFADEGSDDAREALNALIESSVCRLSKDGSTVGLHPLQGLMIRESWEAEPAHRERIEKETVGLLDVVNAVFIRESQGENRRREALDLVDQLRAIADQDYSRDLFADPRTGKILASGLLYVMELEGVEAVISLSDAVENLGRALGPDNSYALISRNNLACAYRDAGRLSEAIDLFGSFYENPREADELIAELGLSGKKDSYVEKLSGGQRQRVSIALALVSRPEIVFLDELTTALDPQARLAMWDVVRTIRDAGCTVVMTTHYMEEAEALCDRVAIVDRGRIIALDTVPGLIAGLGGANLVTLKTSRPVSPEIFTNVAGVSRASIDGLTVRLHSAGGFPGEAVRAIEAAGAAVEDIETSKASLEDVFLALTGRAMREGN